MTARDVDRLIWQLTAGAEAAARLCAHIPDLHDQAFLRQVSAPYETSGNAWPPPGVETVGDQRARTLWARLCATAVDLDTLAPLERSILNYFTAGRSPDPTRGAIISKGEFAAAQRRQRARQAAGEYTPTPIEQQPGWGGAR